MEQKNNKNKPIVLTQEQEEFLERRLTGVRIDYNQAPMEEQTQARERAVNGLGSQRARLIRMEEQYEKLMREVENSEISSEERLISERFKNSIENQKLSIVFKERLYSDYLKRKGFI